MAIIGNIPYFQTNPYGFVYFNLAISPIRHQDIHGPSETWLRPTWLRLLSSSSIPVTGAGRRLPSLVLADSGPSLHLITTLLWFAHLRSGKRNKKAGEISETPHRKRLEKKPLSSKLGYVTNHYKSRIWLDVLLVKSPIFLGETPKKIAAEIHCFWWESRYIHLFLIRRSSIRHPDVEVASAPVLGCPPLDHGT